MATRRVWGLLAAGARVIVISALLSPELQTVQASGAITHIPYHYAEEHLAATGASIVFAATNDAAVNGRVAEDARRRGLWVNVADDPAGSDFQVPSTIQRQDLTLAISTGGASPAFARYVRTILEQALGEALGQALEMIAQARPLILAEAKERQAQLWEDLLALRLETIIETQGYAPARQTFEQWLEASLSSHERGEQHEAH